MHKKRKVVRELAVSCTLTVKMDGMNGFPPQRRHICTALGFVGPELDWRIAPGKQHD